MELAYWAAMAQELKPTMSGNHSCFVLINGQVPMNATHYMPQENWSQCGVMSKGMAIMPIVRNCNAYFNSKCDGIFVF